MPSSSPLLGVTGSVSTTDGAAKAAASRRRIYLGPPGRPRAGWTTLNYDPKTNTAWYGSLHLNNRYLTSCFAPHVEAVPPTCDAARVAGEESA